MSLFIAASALAFTAIVAALILSPLGWLNFVVLQWFGFRLARRYKRVVLREDLVGALLESIGAVRRDERPHRLVPIGWGIIRWVWPLTGWWSPRRWILRRGDIW